MEPSLTAPLPLTTVVQPYAWGSTTAIPNLLGTEPDGRPWAELWLGAHPKAPSAVEIAGESVPLTEAITAHSVEMLGPRVADEFGPRLPFLLKLLAAEQALSLQVHPKAHLAREGFNRENAAGIPLTHPHRSYLDDQHKPELVVALSQFEVLVGFRSPRTILAMLSDLPGELVARVRGQLIADRSDASMRTAFRSLLAARGQMRSRADLNRTVAEITRRLEAGSPYHRAYQTVQQLAREYPGDPGALASLMMNRSTLEPGDGMFTPAGEVHAYLSGLSIEVMASSDNVLRAGLTNKYVAEAELVRCASFTPQQPQLPQVQTAGGRGQVETYRVPVPEFALTTADIDETEAVGLPSAGPRILLNLDGEVELRTQPTLGSPASTPLPRGRAVFVPHAAGTLQAGGAGHVICAWVP